MKFVMMFTISRQREDQKVQSGHCNPPIVSVDRGVWLGGSGASCPCEGCMRLTTQIETIMKPL